MKSSLRTSSPSLTAVSVYGGWVKLLQARPQAEGIFDLLGMKARRVADSDEESMAQTLKEWVQSLPESPREVVGLFPSNALFTRYLSLPSRNPEELRAMALYQMEGSLPYPLSECVVSVRPLGPVGEATRVLAVVARRADLERLLRVCRLAGLNPSRITPSTEAIGRWHQAVSPQGGQAAKVWLSAEFTQEGLDLGVFHQGSLVYVRHVPHQTGDLEELAARMEETAQAYMKEEIGPQIRLVTLSGRLDLLAPAALERLEARLGLRVHRVDSLKGVAAPEPIPDVSFSDLLGAVSSSRLLELDLLPSEVRQKQAQQAMGRQVRQVGLLAAGLVLALAVWAGGKTVLTSWTLQRYQEQARQLQPQAARVQRKAEAIRAVRAAGVLYDRQIRWINSGTRHLQAGMTLQFLGLEGDRLLVLRGTAPDWAALNSYSGLLQHDPLWKKVTLRSARVQEKGQNVEFELALFP